MLCLFLAPEPDIKKLLHREKNVETWELAIIIFNMLKIKKVLSGRRTAEARTLDSKMLPIIAENWIMGYCRSTTLYDQSLKDQW